MHYLDNAATTPVHPEVARLAGEVLESQFANPSSLYRQGMRAQQSIDEARIIIAKALGFTLKESAQQRKEVVFTASGTEANNLALLGLARARRGWGQNIVTTGYEHPSVQNTLAHLAAKEGWRVDVVGPEPGGEVDEEKLLAAVDEKTALVAVMQLNNETGAAADIQALAGEIKRRAPRAAVHVDAVQSFTKLALRPVEWGIDSVAMSAHKLHGPKGVGALYLRRGLALEPVLQGGGQEGALRPGTENTAYIAAFGKATELARQSQSADAKTIAALGARLWAGLGRLGGVARNSPAGAWPGIANFSLPGIKSENMLHFLEEREILVSSGSACHKGRASHTLTAMGLPANRVDSAIRVSFSGQNTAEDVDALLAGLEEGLATLIRRLVISH